jgi:hypothetical protein
MILILAGLSLTGHLLFRRFMVFILLMSQYCLIILTIRIPILIPIDRFFNKYKNFNFLYFFFMVLYITSFILRSYYSFYSHGEKFNGIKVAIFVNRVSDIDDIIRIWIIIWVIICVIIWVIIGVIICVIIWVNGGFIWGIGGIICVITWVNGGFIWVNGGIIWVNGGFIWVIGGIIWVIIAFKHIYFLFYFSLIFF